MRPDVIDDEAVLICAKRLIEDGKDPTGLAVMRAMNHKWTESPIQDALHRLRSSGRLVVTLPKPVRRGPLDAEPEYDAGEIEGLAREVRHDGPKRTELKPAETITEWLRRLYWTGNRRDLYRRATT